MTKQEAEIKRNTNKHLVGKTAIQKGNGAIVTITRISVDQIFDTDSYHVSCSLSGAIGGTTNNITIDLDMLLNNYTLQ